MDSSENKHRRFSDVGLKGRLSSARLDEFFKNPGQKLSMLALNMRKRKRHKTPDEDSISLQSVDIEPVNTEPKKKRRSLSKLSSSLVNMLSPLRPVKNVAHVMKRSMSSLSINSPQRNLPKEGTPSKKHQTTPYRKPGKSTPKRRESSYWYQTVNEMDLQQLDEMQLKRQEAIYELYKGEDDLIEDLHLVKTHYERPLEKLGLLKPDEVHKIFSGVDQLLPIHQDLVDQLKEQRMPDGTTEFVGEVILHWAPKLEQYAAYCSSQFEGKSVLDSKKQDPAIEDFLERCRDSPFSRKLDLWSFLDVPRGRLVKYPLLLRSILKYTPEDHSDSIKLEEAIETIEDIIKLVDDRTGDSKCQFIKSKLEFLSDDQKFNRLLTSSGPKESDLIKQSTAILCDGVLKNNRGTKLHVFLFEKILVLTRLSTRTGDPRYQIHRTPIPVSELLLETEGDGKHGSFRSGLSQGHSSKLAFRVSFLTGDKGMAHTLVANDEHDKRQWMNALRSVLPPGHEGRDKRRPASRSGSNASSCQQAGARENPEGFNMSDISMNSSASSSMYDQCGHSSVHVKRSGSSVSDRVSAVAHAEMSGVKRSGSSVSDHLVAYGDYSGSRLRHSPRQLDVLDESDGEMTARSSKRRRSATATATVSSAAAATRDDSVGECLSQSPAGTPRRRSARLCPASPEFTEPSSPGWGEGHTLDDVREERGTADGMEKP